jgi:hypothetical protein
MRGQWNSSAMSNVHTKPSEPPSVQNTLERIAKALERIATALEPEHPRSKHTTIWEHVSAMENSIEDIRLHGIQTREQSN